MTPLRHSISATLGKLIEASMTRETITIGECIELLGHRSFGLAMLMFSLPNSLPVPGIPGFSTVTGLPIFFIGVQLALGRQSLWFPPSIARKAFPFGGMGKLLTKIQPAMEKVEKYLHPRWLVITDPLGRRVVGLWCVMLALVLMLPIPGGNFLPGLSLTLIALSLLERDGFLLVCAMFFAAGSLTLMYKVITLFFATVFEAIGIF